MKLNPDVKYVWIIYSLRSSLFLFIILLILDIVFLNEFINDIIQNNLNSSINIPIIIFPLLIFTFLVIYNLIVIFVGYNFWEFEIKENEIELQRGIFTKIKTTVPFNRIQHIDLRQNIIERFFELASIFIYTAGTKGSDLYIPGLPKYYSEYLRENLKNYIKEDIV